MLAMHDSWLEVTLPDLAGECTQKGQFHYVWLRDNCACSDCRHPDTHERILATASIQENARPNEATLNDKILRVVWEAGAHISEYPLTWLREHNYSAPQAFSECGTSDYQLWGRELQDNIPTFDYQELYSNPRALLAWCEAIRDIGLTVITGAPTREGEIERFASFVAVVRETIYDRLHNVRATPQEYNAYNVASTTLELKPHTDMPVYNNPPGVQMFHFLVNDAEGGESTAVDGFHVAKALQSIDPEAYQLLATTPVSFRMFSTRADVQSRNPLLTLDCEGNLKVIRFSNQLAQPMNVAPERMEAFYRAYLKLARLVESPTHKIQFRLSAGDIMVTNNLRVLHGRNAYDGRSGARHLQLSYIDYDEVISRIRMLKASGVS